MEYEEESASRLHLRSRLGSIYSLLPFNTARKERRDKDREREKSGRGSSSFRLCGGSGLDNKRAMAL